MQHSSVDVSHLCRLYFEALGMHIAVPGTVRCNKLVMRHLAHHAAVPGSPFGSLGMEGMLTVSSDGDILSLLCTSTRF